MAAVTSLSFSSISQSKFSIPSPRNLASNFDAFKFRSTISSLDSFNLRVSTSSRVVIHCISTSTDVPTVCETKLNFLKAYKKLVPSIYNTVLQELIVQQHLMRYKSTYRYDPVFALGFVTVYDQLMEGYPSDEDRDTILKAYIMALNEDPDQYRADARKLEKWARSQSASTLVDFASREGEVEAA